MSITFVPKRVIASCIFSSAYALQYLLVKHALAQVDEVKGTAEIYADRSFAKGQGIVESYGDNANHM